ncbi:putative solute:sodium symporter small subunit [Burkholderiales bacterium JOSHI_001]|nr:putative solute:sodium symporter small subunit [Burkholderiales bacterium JOSHI_001]
MNHDEKVRRYWPRTATLTWQLMALWFGATFGVAYFARDLNFSFFGWPFSFWVGAQGALIVYLLLIWAYARAMDRMDRELGLDRQE